MHGKIQITALVACVMLVLPAAAFASDTNGTTNTAPKVNPHNLEIAVSNTVCQVNATTSYLQNVININQTKFASLNQDLTELNGDITTLQGYVSNNDSQGFKSFVQGQLKNDTRSTNIDVIHTMRSANMTKDQGATFKSDNDQLKSANKACAVATKQEIKTLMTANHKDLLAQMELKNKKLLEQMQNRTHNLLVHIQNVTDIRIAHIHNMTENRLAHMPNMTADRIAHIENMTEKRIGHMQNVTENRIQHIENMSENRLSHMENRSHPANPTAAANP